MSKVFATRLSIYSIGLIISSAIERGFTSVIVHITKGFIESGSISYHVLSLIILIVLFILINILLKPLIQKEFVTKFILGKEYIGGRWVEAVVTENNKIAHITKIDITYNDDEINIHGDCYCYQNMQLRYKYCFNSICASMDNSNYLTYVFTSKEGMEDGKKEIGYLHFDRIKLKWLNKYYGDFEDRGKKFKIFAILIENKSIIKKMDDDFIGTVKEQDILTKIEKMHNITFVR